MIISGIISSRMMIVPVSFVADAFQDISEIPLPDPVTLLVSFSCVRQIGNIMVRNDSTIVMKNGVDSSSSHH